MCLQKVNPCKAAGSDNIPGQVLRDTSSQVLTDIFNSSLSQVILPTCLKTATIIPVPKSSTVSCLNDYSPVALTLIIMKCFERLVMAHMKNTIDLTVDPHQYAYRQNCSTADAISSVVHLALTYLESRTVSRKVRLLFLDFSSTFNTIIPQTLLHQTLLYTLLTCDCSAKHLSNHIVNLHDMAVVGLITRRNEYRQEVEKLEAWCKVNNLSINTEKTKEMIVVFRKTGTTLRRGSSC